MSSLCDIYIVSKRHYFKEEEKMKLNLTVLKGINEVFKRLNNLRRWTSFISEDKYNELGKQALNSIVAYMLASYSEKAGTIIHWERFPKIALYRAFQKVYVYFDTPEHIINEICKIGNINKSAFDEVTKDIIGENTSEEFAEFLCEGCNTTEFQIYRAAIKIATYIELVEISSKMRESDYAIKSHELIKAIEEFEDLPGVSEISDVEGKIFKLLLKICTLRNKNRWAVQSYSVECSVQGHLFDTGIFAYLFSLEQEMSGEMSGKMFFMGIFHDVAETWTGDIPSPIKDRIPGFRDATEEYERRVVKSELYNKLPEFLANKVKDIMFEEEENEEYYSLVKGADYLSADSECWRQYHAGTRDEYFLGAMNRRIPKIESGEVMLTDACENLYNDYVGYARNVN